MFCDKCGNKINEGAAFCAKCGNKIEVYSSTNEKVFSATQNDKSKRMKKWPIVVIVVVVVVIAFVWWFIWDDPFNLAGRSNQIIGTSNIHHTTDSPDPNYDDVIRLIQGEWYLWNSKSKRRISIDGEQYYETIEYTGGMSAAPNEGNIEPTDKRGELKVVDDFNGQRRLRQTLYYKYDEGSDSVVLTLDGDELTREDIYNNILELLQGEWYLELNGIENTIIFNGSKYEVNGERPRSKPDAEIYPSGKIRLPRVNHSNPSDEDCDILS